MGKEVGTIQQILALLEKLILAEQLIETKIKQVKDVKTRKAIVEAVRDRDRDALNKLLFDN